MTREEAHRILSNGLANAPSEHEWCTAYEMAIQALSQEPCDDAISRDAVLLYIDEVKKGEIVNFGTLLDMARYYRSLPSVTQKSGWIPASVRLPEDTYGCLVTVYDTDLRTQDEFENILPYFVGYDGETWNNADGEPIPFEVIAWMPLPKPYEPQERSDKE